MSLADRYLDWKNLCVNKILFNVVYSQNNMLLAAKLVAFLCSVISQGKVVALDRWGGKWNHLSMTHWLTSIYAKNYCNRTLIVKVIIENVVTCFFGTQCSWKLVGKTSFQLVRFVGCSLYWSNIIAVVVKMLMHMLAISCWAGCL